MPFEFEGMSFGRGRYSNSSLGTESFATHAYKSEVDSLAAIQAPNYFPPFLGLDEFSVKVGDELKLISTDETTSATITESGVDSLTVLNDQFRDFNTNWSGAFVTPQFTTLRVRNQRGVVTINFSFEQTANSNATTLIECVCVCVCVVCGVWCVV